MQMNTPPRPQITPEIIQTALQQYATEHTLSGDQLLDLSANYVPGDIGYDLAKKLDDNCGWTIDSNLVEQLDEVQWYVEAAHADAVRAWVTEHNIKPPFAIGERVTFGPLLEEGVIDALADAERNAALRI